MIPTLILEVSVMNLLRTLRRLFPARPARRPQARPRVRPLLEALEDRSVEVSTMNLLRTLRRLFPAHHARRPQARPRVRLLLEALEDRAVPTAYAWVGPAGGAWGAGANWQNALTHTVGTVPGPTDDALFGAPGADTSCLVNGSFAADRVVMAGD